MEESIAAMQPISDESVYTSYYRELRENQREAFRRELERLIDRAREFNFTDYKTRLYRDGALSEAERTHLNIVQTIVEARIETLAEAFDDMVERLEGA